MEKITHGAIKKLLENEKQSPNVTIYSPTHKSASPPHMSEDQIRLKNLVSKAIEELERRSDGKELANELARHRDKLLADQEFWEAQSEGLLICAQPGSIKMFQLPMDTEEYVAVDDCFHLAPVLSLVQDGMDFYVLNVAQHHPALYKGDMYGMQLLNVEFPDSVEEGLLLDEVNQKSEHARSASGSSLNTTGFQGRGGARDPREADRARFFRMIDKIVCTHIDSSAPLLLAGIDTETAEYRHLSKHSNILSSTINGGFSRAKPEDLFVAAKAIVQEEIINKRHLEAVEEFQMLKGANPDRVAVNKDDIADAADQGRVDKLLVRMLRYTADTVKDTRESVARITFPEDGISAAINKLAAKVWQTSGKIIGLEASTMPDGAPMVARLRY